ncbi:hypothetical protein LR48_Vigan11g061000 [Vigna angularis]|uniref:Uncharacterized protein n=1 Tax=Phaseolus angularis TaxID=3914 RepID=A0A0L9VRT7_PHAAN|nr:hypothetical protein LR48_Vigan11g061000 [Vigna angularis]
MDDVFQKFMQESISTQKTIEASCKRMEMQIGHSIETLEDFRVETEVNPREECQAIITRSDKTLDEKELERKEKEELSEKDKDVKKEREVVEREERKKICVKIKKMSGKREEKKKVGEKKMCVKIKKVREKEKRTRGKKKESYEKPHPHPKKYHRKEKKFERFMEIFKKLDIKVPMIETLKQNRRSAEISPECDSCRVVFKLVLAAGLMYALPHQLVRAFPLCSKHALFNSFDVMIIGFIDMDTYEHIDILDVHYPCTDLDLYDSLEDAADDLEIGKKIFNERKQVYSEPEIPITLPDLPIHSNACDLLHTDSIGFMTETDTNLIDHSKIFDSVSAIEPIGINVVLNGHDCRDEILNDNSLELTFDSAIDAYVNIDAELITDAINCEFDDEAAELNENAGVVIKEFMVDEGECIATALSEPEVSILVSHTQQLPVEGELLMQKFA